MQTSFHRSPLLVAESRRRHRRREHAPLRRTRIPCRGQCVVVHQLDGTEATGRQATACASMRLSGDRRRSSGYAVWGREVRHRSILFWSKSSAPLEERGWRSRATIKPQDQTCPFTMQLGHDASSGVDADEKVARGAATRSPSSLRPVCLSQPCLWCRGHRSAVAVNSRPSMNAGVV